MKHTYLLTALLFTLLVAPFAQAQNPIILTSKDDANLRIVDTSTFFITSTNTMTASGSTINGVTGVAVHPCNGAIYMMLKIASQSGRSLATTDTNGSVTIIGNTGDNFAEIAFDDNGVLYGVTGDGATNSETLYTINLKTASITQVVVLGNGDDGETIAFSPDDGHMYHWSGNGSTVFERINLTNNTVTNIPFTNGSISLDEIFAATYYGDGQFLITNIDDSLFLIDTNGYASSTGLGTNFSCKGLAFIPPGAITVSTNAESLCPGDSALLTASTGSSHQWYLNGQSVSGATNQTYAVGSGGVYNCVVNNTFCIDSASVGILIEDVSNPSVNLSYSDSVICPGQTVLISGSNGGSSQWFLNGDTIPGETNTGIFATEGGWYNMTKTNNNGCSDSASMGAFITLYDSPNVDLGPDAGICPNDTLVLDAGTFTNSTYNWSTTATSQTIGVTDSGTYTVFVISENNCFGYDTIYISALPEAFIELWPDTLLCVGNNYTLDAGTGYSSYLWDDGATTQTRVISEGSITNVTYSIVVENNSGCEGTDSFVAEWMICGGIADIGAESALVVYPNPSNGSFRIEGDQLSNLTVRNLLGEVVLIQNNVLPNEEFTVTEAGVYMIEASNGNSVKTARLVITE